MRRLGLDRVILRAFNKNQILILEKIKKAGGRPITSILREIADENKISISTLKFNARVLRDLELIRLEKASERRIAKLSELGNLVLEIVREKHLIDYESFQKKAVKLREKLLETLNELGNSHLTSSLTCMNIILALFAKLFTSSKTEKSENVLILSKGHAAPALYVAMVEFGLLKEEELKAIGELKSRLQTHVVRGLPLIKVSTGSLGQGLSIANGIAMAAKMDGKNAKVYVVLGDGELDEGQVWEAAMTSSNYRLDNIIAIIDRNGSQLSGLTEKIKKKEPLKSKWESFGWEVFEVNGYYIEELSNALDQAEEVRGRPTVIIVKTSVN